MVRFWINTHNNSYKSSKVFQKIYFLNHIAHLLTSYAVLSPVSWYFLKDIWNIPEDSYCKKYKLQLDKVRQQLPVHFALCYLLFLKSVYHCLLFTLNQYLKISPMIQYHCFLFCNKGMQGEVSMRWVSTYQNLARTILTKPDLSAINQILLRKGSQKKANNAAKSLKAMLRVHSTGNLQYEK